MIEFLENKHGNFALSAIYLWRSVKHFGLGLYDILKWLHERVVKRYTLVCMAVVVFLSVFLSTVQIGKARAERDQACKQLYVMQQKIDSCFYLFSEERLRISKCIVSSLKIMNCIFEIKK